MSHNFNNPEFIQWLSSYFSNRGEFLAQVIRADMMTTPRYQQLVEKGNLAKNSNISNNGHLGNGFAFENNGYSSVNAEEITQNGRPANEHHYNGSSISSGTHSKLNRNFNGTETSSGVDVTDHRSIQTRDLRQEIMSTMISQIAEKTGYPSESIKHEARLLDDLNLDSIKAGELIASVAKQYDVVGELDPSTLAQATIAEVADAIYSQSPVPTVDVSSVPTQADSSVSVDALLIDLVAETTGYPKSSLSIEMRLLDDLNLDSIKAADLVSKVAKKLDLQGQLDAAELSNATLADVSAALQSARGPQPLLAPEETRNIPLSVGSSNLEMPKWVRNFGLNFVEESLQPSADTNWSAAKINLLTTEEDCQLVDVLAHKMRGLGAHVVITSAKDLLIAQSDYFNFTHYIVVLPQPRTFDATNISSSFPLKEMSEWLKSAASSHISATEFVAYVQFGGGFFGQSDTCCVSPESACASGFARSLHLERPSLRVRVVDLSAQLALEVMADLVIAELVDDRSIVTAGYDANLVRRVPQSVLHQPTTYTPRPIQWSSHDVVLVTGGAKGIAAECALAIAQGSGIKMALVGRSSAPTHADDEISKTLERYRLNGLTAQYYSCDISNPNEVTALFSTITQELGSITGVIHGAGLNSPKLVEQVNLEDAQSEMGAKLLGAQNILNNLAATPPKLFMAFTSIIGVTGMPGNTWYAFANETLALMLRRFNMQHPETSVISLAYSVWEEIGMGARMGSVKKLERMGIGAISPKEGIGRSVQLFHYDPGTQQVIIAARLGGLDTWSPVPQIETKDLRFIEDITHLEPGVEITVRTKLTIERDLYVKDHIWRGSYLFPTVFGLEAMAQASAVVIGTRTPSIIRIENISLRRPVVVDPQNGVQIEIHAEVTELNAKGEQHIRIGIKTEQSSFSHEHFSATFVIGDRPSSHSIQFVMKDPLAIVPKRDLYGGLLFQGELFQEMGDIYSLSREKSLLSSHVRSAEDLKEVGFPQGQGNDYILGDPYFRDVLLQCMQLNIPQDICLPVEVEKIEMFEHPAHAQGERIITAILNQKVGQEYICEVIATDSAGNIREHLQGYRLRILEEHPENPSASELENPAIRDQELLEKALFSSASDLGVELPSFAFTYSPRLGQEPKEVRREKEQPLVENAIKQSLQYSNPDKPLEFTIDSHPSGKPYILSSSHLGQEINLDLSISHDEHYCLCTVGQNVQGCDIESLHFKSKEDWLGLLSDSRSQIFNQLLSAGDDVNIAGTRIWTSLEALHKAHNGLQAKLSIAKKKGEAILFKVEVNEQGHHVMEYFILTVPVRLTRMPERMVAILVELNPIQDQQTSIYVDSYGLIKANDYRARITEDGPQNQAVFEKRFQATFKEACSIGRTVTVSQYIKWVGKIREMPLKSMAAEMLPDFLGGEYGMVTNGVTLKVLGEATTYDIIQARCWLGNLSGSSFSTYIEFCKVLPDESLVRIAMSEVRATWVRIVGYGIPEPDSLPDYLQSYIDQFAATVPATINIKESATDSLPKLSQPLSSFQVGQFAYRGTSTPLGDLLLSEVFQTTLEESNVVGNIYYGNYFTWQGRMLDLFLYSVAPKYFRVTKSQGEMLSLFSDMNFMREAMPFDKIMVKLYLKGVSECGAEFNFEFFRENSNNSLEKLHSGEQQVVWVKRDNDGTPVITPWPTEIRQALTSSGESNLSNTVNNNLSGKNPALINT